MKMLKDPPTVVTDVARLEEALETDERAQEPEPKVEPLGPVGRPRILVGTAGWTEPTLIECGRFYPKGCRSDEARLRHYATRFPLVEVDSDAALTSRSDFESWARWTPAGFSFNVKAFRLFTGHRVPVDALPAPLQAALGRQARTGVHYEDLRPELLDALWNLFTEAIEPLRTSDKLGAVHFRFAPSFVCAPAQRKHLDDLRARLAEYTLSLEFQHESWFDDRHRQQTLEFEKERGFVNMALDGPRASAIGVSANWVVTNPALAALRLYGRNAATSERFDYDYTDAELETLSSSIRDMAARVGAMHVVFSNNCADQGQRNATTLMRLLGLLP